MTIAEQIAVIKAALVSWSKQNKGNVHVAGDAAHLFRLLANSPGSLRAVILFDAETKRGEFESSGGVDRKFLVVISRGVGFKLDPADNLVEGSAGGRPLYDLIEEGRETVRALRFTGDGQIEPEPDYKGTNRTQFEGLLATDAYQIEFTLGTQLPIHE